MNGNQVEMSAGTVGGDVYGGCSGNGAVTGNIATISGGTVRAVYGGRSYGTVKNNHVNISAGTVDGSSEYGGIFGGCSYGDAATGNTVTISGGTLTGKVVGGASNTATDNNIILAKGAAAANLQSATLYGSTKYNYDTSLPGNHSGNTLTVDKEKNITVATVKNFDVYDFQLGYVENGDVILNLLDNTDLGTADVTVKTARIKR